MARILSHSRVLRLAAALRHNIGLWQDTLTSGIQIRLSSDDGQMSQRERPNVAGEEGLGSHALLKVLEYA